MNIQLNGEPRTLPASATLHDLLEAEQLLQRRVAVEVNGEIVSRSRHREHVRLKATLSRSCTRWVGAEACPGLPASGRHYPCRSTAGTPLRDPIFRRIGDNRAMNVHVSPIRW